MYLSYSFINLVFDSKLLKLLIIFIWGTKYVKNLCKFIVLIVIFSKQKFRRINVIFISSDSVCDYQEIMYFIMWPLKK